MRFKKGELAVTQYGTLVTVGEGGRVNPLNGASGFFINEGDLHAPTLGERTAFNPNSPLAKYLVGKKVMYADDFGSLEESDMGILGSVGENRVYPFQVPGSGTAVGWKFVAALETKTEEPTIEVTMEEVCAKFGKNVKIKKEN